MAGNWRVNVILGLIVFLLTLLFSLVNNTWQTSFVRAGFGFLIFLLLGYLLQFILHQIASSKSFEPREHIIIQEDEQLAVDKKVFVEEKTSNDSSFQAIPLKSLHHGEDRTSN